MGLRHEVGLGTRPIMKLAQLLPQLKTPDADARAHSTAGKEGVWVRKPYPSPTHSQIFAERDNSSTQLTSP